jgi:hypothetical protein
MKIVPGLVKIQSQYGVGVATITCRSQASSVIDGVLAATTSTQSKSQFEWAMLIRDAKCRNVLKGDSIDEARLLHANTKDQRSIFGILYTDQFDVGVLKRRFPCLKNKMRRCRTGLPTLPSDHVAARPGVILPVREKRPPARCAAARAWKMKSRAR